VRHVLNKAAGSPHRPSTFARSWFDLFHRSQLSVIRQAGVLFVHVPRTGGTSISQLLYGRNLPHVSLAFWHNVGGHSIQRLPSFSIIRSPVARIASAYRFIRSGGTSLRASSRHDPLGVRKLPSFAAFVDALALQPAYMQSYDVLRPQSEYVTDPSGRLLVDRLFSFEEIAQGAPNLRRWLGLDDIPVLKASQGDPPAVLVRTRQLIESLYEDDLRLHDSLRAESTQAELPPFLADAATPAL
jgi:hypothetical protein